MFDYTQIYTHPCTFYIMLISADKQNGWKEQVLDPDESGTNLKEVKRGEPYRPIETSFSVERAD